MVRGRGASFATSSAAVLPALVVLPDEQPAISSAAAASRTAPVRGLPALPVLRGQARRPLQHPQDRSGAGSAGPSGPAGAAGAVGAAGPAGRAGGAPWVHVASVTVRDRLSAVCARRAS